MPDARLQLFPHPGSCVNERKRLRLENELRLEQRKSADLDRDDELQRQFTRILAAFERIADVMELWADKQAEAL